MSNVTLAKPCRLGGADGLRARGRFRLAGEPADVLREQPFLALDLLVVDRFAVLQRAEAVAFDAGEVNEDVFPLRAENEPEALLRVEPLDVSLRHGRTPTKRVEEARNPRVGFPRRYSKCRVATRITRPA